jgi:hypothetical protein
VTWYSHKLTTFSLVLLAFHDIGLSIASAITSVIPDSVEGFNYDSERWKKNHRRLSHWPVIYLILLVAGAVILLTHHIKFWKVLSYKALLSLMHNHDAFFYALTGYALLVAGLGGLLHILEDSLSSTVPLLHPTKRTFGFHILKTGSFLEYLISTTLAAVVIYFIYLK